MIHFHKSSENLVVMTLTENSTVPNPIYLFKFENQQTLKPYYFIATDTSLYKNRYNSFLVTEKTNPNTLNGEVSLGNEGFYNYTVYETDLANTSGLTNAAEAVENIVRPVEYGLVWVVPTAGEIDKYNPDTLESIVYNP